MHSSIHLHRLSTVSSASFNQAAYGKAFGSQNWFHALHRHKRKGTQFKRRQAVKTQAKGSVASPVPRRFSQVCFTQFEVIKGQCVGWHCMLAAQTMGTASKNRQRETSL